LNEVTRWSIESPDASQVLRVAGGIVWGLDGGWTVCREGASTRTWVWYRKVGKNRKVEVWSQRKPDLVYSLYT